MLYGINWSLLLLKIHLSTSGSGTHVHVQLQTIGQLQLITTGHNSCFINLQVDIVMFPVENITLISKSSKHGDSVFYTEKPPVNQLATLPYITTSMPFDLGFGFIFSLRHKSGADRHV